MCLHIATQWSDGKTISHFTDGIVAPSGQLVLSSDLSYLTVAIVRISSESDHPNYYRQTDFDVTVLYLWVLCIAVRSIWSVRVTFLLIFFHFSLQLVIWKLIVTTNFGSPQSWPLHEGSPFSVLMLALEKIISIKSTPRTSRPSVVSFWPVWRT